MSRVDYTKMEKQNIVELHCRDYSAQVNLSRGANCISLRHGKYRARILREPDGSKEVDNPYLYGMPILFPVNRIEGGEFEFEGRIYHFPVNEPKTGCHLHGELHKREFTLLKKTDNRLLCSYRADVKAPYLDFPHEFEIRMEYELREDGFHHRTEIKNNSADNMPVFLGFHTTFQALFTQGSRKQDIRVLTEISEEYERNMENYLPTGNKPEFDEVSNALKEGDFSPFEGAISRHYRSTKGGRMVIYDKKQNLSVVYENDVKYNFRLIYNGNADEYICLEPQNCLANCPNSPFSREEAGFDYLAPGKSKTYTSAIYISEGDRR